LKTVFIAEFPFIAPVRSTQSYATEGNTIYLQSEVLEKRESRSRPGIGIVNVKTSGINQDGAIVITFKRTVTDYRRGQAPAMPHPATT
jgi:itaconyl-CoA hydratase